METAFTIGELVLDRTDYKECIVVNYNPKSCRVIILESPYVANNFRSYQFNNLDKLKKINLDTDNAKFIRYVKDMSIRILSDFGIHNWTPEFFINELKRDYNNLMSESNKYKFNFNKITLEELLLAGGVVFDKENKKTPLVLLPLWMLEFVPDGTELEDIFSEKVIKGKDNISTDTRTGVISYGVRK